jgi:hypothetical protein
LLAFLNNGTTDIKRKKRVKFEDEEEKYGICKTIRIRSNAKPKKGSELIPEVNSKTSEQESESAIEVKEPESTPIKPTD